MKERADLEDRMRLNKREFMRTGIRAFQDKFFEANAEYAEKFGAVDYADYQRIHRFRETDYDVKAAEWRLLDTANPAFRLVDYSGKGKNMQAESSIRPGEDSVTYWRRVIHSEWEKRRSKIIAADMVHLAAITL